MFSVVWVEIKRQKRLVSERRWRRSSRGSFREVSILPRGRKKVVGRKERRGEPMGERRPGRVATCLVKVRTVTHELTRRPFVGNSRRAKVNLESIRFGTVEITALRVCGTGQREIAISSCNARLRYRYCLIITIALLCVFSTVTGINESVPFPCQLADIDKEPARTMQIRKLRCKRTEHAEAPFRNCLLPAGRE